MPIQFIKRKIYSWRNVHIIKPFNFPIRLFRTLQAFGKNLWLDLELSSCIKRSQTFNVWPDTTVPAGKEDVYRVNLSLPTYIHQGFIPIIVDSISCLLSNIGRLSALAAHSSLFWLGMGLWGCIIIRGVWGSQITGAYHHPPDPPGRTVEEAGAGMTRPLRWDKDVE